MVSIYLAAVLLIGATSIIGQAVLCLAGARSWSWLAPAVGLATLIVIETVIIRLPGRGTTAWVVTVVLLLAAAAFLAWRVKGSLPWRAALVCIPPLLMSALPFLAVNRPGMLGVSLLNDMASHLMWASALLSAHVESLYPLAAGYPLGPHSLVATLTSVSGVRLDYAFDGLLAATLPITALTAAAAVPNAALWRRALIGLLSASAYLAVASYGEAAFKEPLMAVMVLCFVIYLRDLAQAAEGGRSLVGWLRAGLPAGLLVAAGLDTYSDVALAWFGGFVVVWALGEVISRPSLVLAPAKRWLLLQRGALLAVGSVVLAAIVLAPTLGHIITYSQNLGTSPSGSGSIPTATLANLVGPISPYEALGLWLQPDFRLQPANGFHAGELGAIAVAVLAFGIWWSLRRRDVALPALVVACAFIYWYSNRTQSPYVTAKALVIAAPIVMFVSARGLLAGREEDSGPWRWTALRSICGVAFALLALFSSSLALRASPVMGQEQVTELAALRPLIGSSPTLFLGNDDFVAWELGGADLGYFDDASVVKPVIPPTSAATPQTKVWSYGDEIDFDSVTPSELDRYRYVITTSGAYASAPPTNFHLIRAERLYDLWERSGPTAPRSLLAGSPAPGELVDCATPAGRTLSHRPGLAATFASPVDAGAIPFMPAGTAAGTTIALPRGRWNLSIDYTSSETLQLTVGGTRFVLPANLSRPGPYYAVGTVESSGRRPLTVSLYEVHPSRLAGSQDIGVVSSLVATRDPDPETLVPLARSCGRYVEWYQPS
jgi:hypothetical protein